MVAVDPAAASSRRSCCSYAPSDSISSPLVVGAVFDGVTLPYSGHVTD